MELADWGGEVPALQVRCVMSQRWEIGDVGPLLLFLPSAFLWRTIVVPVEPPDDGGSGEELVESNGSRHGSRWAMMDVSSL
jgi:hypothetical protein